MSCPLPVECCLLSVVCYMLSVVFCLLSAVCCLLWFVVRSCDACLFFCVFLGSLRVVCSLFVCLSVCLFVCACVRLSVCLLFDVRVFGACCLFVCACVFEFFGRCLLLVCLLFFRFHMFSVAFGNGLLVCSAELSLVYPGNLHALRDASVWRW